MKNRYKFIKESLMNYECIVNEENIALVNAVDMGPQLVKKLILPFCK